MSKPGEVFREFQNFFSDRNYEKSRRFNQSFQYDPEPLRNFLNFLDNPQFSCRTIHVAGSVGKGSVSIYMARALSFEGTIGLYTSPHLETLTERICIVRNGVSRNISEREFLAIWSEIKEMKLISEISYFDALTAIAMLYFRNQEVPWAVFETGLGGRLDSTNNLKSEFSIITPIGLDHQNILGHTIEEITSEKAGIIKREKPVYAYQTTPESRSCLEKICLDMKSPVRFFTPDPEAMYQQNNLNFVKWIYKDYFKKNMPQIEMQFKGRLEVMHKNPLIVFDSAHNEPAFHALLKWLNLQPGSWNIYVNIMKERSLSDIIRLISSYKSTHTETKLYLFPFSETGYYTSAEVNQSREIIPLTRESLVEKISDPDRNHIVCGSMRLYPAVREIARELSLP